MKYRMLKMSLFPFFTPYQKHETNITCKISNNVIVYNFIERLFFITCQHVILKKMHQTEEKTICRNIYLLVGNGIVFKQVSSSSIEQGIL